MCNARQCVTHNMFWVFILRRFLINYPLYEYFFQDFHANFFEIIIELEVLYKTSYRNIFFEVAFKNYKHISKKKKNSDFLVITQQHTDGRL